jgi:hypothetical protein
LLTDKWPARLDLVQYGNDLFAVLNPREEHVNLRPVRGFSNDMTAGRILDVPIKRLTRPPQEKADDYRARLTKQRNTKGPGRLRYNWDSAEALVLIHEEKGAKK